MNAASLKALGLTCTEAIQVLMGKVLDLRVADVRQPTDKDPVISLSLNGSTLEMPKPVSNAIGRVDVWLPGSSKAELTKAGIRVGSVLQVRVKSITASCRFVEPTVDPVSGATTKEGGVYADATAVLDHLYVRSTPPLFSELLAGAPLTGAATTPATAPLPA